MTERRHWGDSPRSGAQAAVTATCAFSSTISPSRASARTVSPSRNSPCEDRQRERVDEALLDDALERPRAVGRVVAEVAQQRARVVGELDLDAALTHAGDQALDLEVDDLADLLAAERLELDDVVEAVDELGLERALHVLRCWRS